MNDGFPMGIFLGILIGVCIATVTWGITRDVGKNTCEQMSGAHQCHKVWQPVK